MGADTAPSRKMPIGWLAMDKLRLHGFNNLTKSLSFNIYDICYARTREQKKAYVAYLDEVFNADRLTQILTEVSEIIGAHILNIARQDYEPEGASVTILIAEEAAYDGPVPDAVVGHLDKSHITVHTYPEFHPDDGIRPPSGPTSMLRMCAPMISETSVRIWPRR